MTLDPTAPRPFSRRHWLKAASAAPLIGLPLLSRAAA